MMAVQTFRINFVGHDNVLSEEMIGKWVLLRWRGLDMSSTRKKETVARRVLLFNILNFKE